MSVKRILADYFHFTRKDRLGLLCLFALILLLNLIPNFLPDRTSTVQFPPDRFLALAEDSLANQEATAQSKRKALAGPARKFTEELPSERFLFDPNTLPAEGWKRLGLPERSIRTLMNYRAKGGKFYKAEDLARVWGLPPGFYESVRNYVQIEGKEAPARPHPAFEKKEKLIQVVNINASDTAAWIALPGIGSKLASRIISFREKLGGFYAVDQVGETYGLADSVFQKIKPYLREGGELKKFNINTVTKEELRGHPYFRWALANAIVEYRNSHGSFKDLKDLKNITLIDEKTFTKLLPYLQL